MKILSHGLFSLSVFGAYGQQYRAMLEDLNINYYEVVDSANSYFKTIDITQKGTGYKDFLRWQYLNESIYAPTGERNLFSPYFASEEFKEFLSQSKKTRVLNSDWRSLCPYRIDTITGHYAVGLGRIEDVYIHPSNMHII